MIHIIIKNAKLILGLSPRFDITENSRNNINETIYIICTEKIKVLLINKFLLS
jgi:hypothetical protein